MAIKLVQPPVPAQHVFPPRTRIPQMIRLIPTTRPWTQTTRFRSTYATKVAEQSSGLIGGNKEIQEQAVPRTPTQIKADLYQVVQGMPT